MDYCPNCWREIHLTTVGFVCSVCGYQVAFYDSESTTAGGMVIDESRKTTKI